MFKELNNKAYRVGGCVRDKLLGKEPHDVDYVIEATEEEFRKVFPDVEHVGKNFPVFLIGGNEVALTRTEKCVGEGYTDYEVTGVGVPIEDDLLRRDFTINSIAEHVVTGAIVDPTGGRKDLEARTLRCSNPDAFSDDPLRIYRGVRFAGRFGLKIESDTLAMMNENSFKLYKVKPERVVLELEKMYESCEKPSMFFKYLVKIGALSVHFDPLTNLLVVPGGPEKYHGKNTAFDHTMEVIDRCKEKGFSFDCFIACLFHDLGKGTTKAEILPHHYGHEMRSFFILVEGFFDQHRFSARTMKLAACVARHHMNMHFLSDMKTRKAVKFFRGIPRDLKSDFLKCCDCDHKLSMPVIKTWAAIETAFDQTEIVIPHDCKDPNEFVTNLIAKQAKFYLDLNSQMEKAYGQEVFSL